MITKIPARFVRERIENDIQDRDIDAYIDDLWSSVGKKFEARSIGANDIEQAIRDVRAAKKVICFNKEMRGIACQF